MEDQTPVTPPPPATNGNFPVFYPSFPGATLTPGFLLHAPVPMLSSIAPSPLTSQGMLPPAGVRYPGPAPDPINLEPLKVLQLASQSIPSNQFIRIPPFRGESPELWRAVMIENIPRYITNLDILRQLKPNNLESVRRSMDNRGTSKVELRFLDHAAALLFYSRYLLNPLTLERQELLSISWSPTSPVSADIKNLCWDQNVSRFIQLEIDMTEIDSAECEDGYVSRKLWNILSGFGTLETLKRMANSTYEGTPKRNSGQKLIESSEATTSNAIVPVSTAPNAPNAIWRAQFVDAESAVAAFREANWNRIVSKEFGSEEPLHKLDQQSAMLFLMKSPYDPTSLTNVSAEELREAATHQSLAAALNGVLSGDEANIGNRCICISRLPPATRLVEVCNTVRGGMLESIKMIPGKHVCFVTFLEPTAAAQFWATYQMMPFYVNCERVRVGWGRNPGLLAPAIAAVVNKNATRNVCIQFDSKVCAEGTNPVLDEVELGKIFAPFGLIEQVRVTREVFCSFVTFANIVNAIQAVDWASKSNRFPKCVVRFGKDRCAALPRCLARCGMTESPLIQLLRRQLNNVMAPTSVMHSPYSMPFLASPTVAVPFQNPSPLLLNSPPLMEANTSIASSFYGASGEENLRNSVPSSDEELKGEAIFGGLLQESSK